MATPGWANTTRLGLDIGVNKKEGSGWTHRSCALPKARGFWPAPSWPLETAQVGSHYVCAGSATCASSSMVV